MRKHFHRFFPARQRSDDDNDDDGGWNFMKLRNNAKC